MRDAEERRLRERALRRAKKRARPRAVPVTRAFDDDGEANGGKRLLGMLNKERALGVAVVVSRWFGGVLPGPARFKHIASTARQALEAGGIAQEVASDTLDQLQRAALCGAADSNTPSSAAGRERLPPVCGRRGRVAWAGVA